MPIASWDDIAGIDESPAQPSRASFADIVSVESPAAPARPRRLATFSDIVSIEPAPSPFSDLEQRVIASSPASAARAKPTVESVFGLKPGLPEPTSRDIGLAPSTPALSFNDLAAHGPSAAARPLRPGPKDTDVIGGVFGAPVGALQALPAAAGEQLAGTTMPGHQGEPPTFFGRAWEHMKMAATGRGGEVVPQSAVTQALVGNPVEAGAPQNPTYNDLAAHGPSAAGVNPKVGELVRRGLGTAAKMLMDPSIVALGAAPSSIAEASAVAFSAMGVESAIETAKNPDATDVDVAEAVINALLMTAPLGARALRAVRTRVAQLADAARPAAEIPRAETPPPVPEAVAGPAETTVPAGAPPPVVEGAAPPALRRVARIEDIVAVEPPAATVSPTLEELLQQVAKTPEASAPNVAHLEDIVRVEPGGPDAVPVQASDAVDVREPPGHGEAVGGGHAQPEAPAGRHPETGAAQEETVGGERVQAVGPPQTARVEDIVSIEPPAAAAETTRASYGAAAVVPTRTEDWGPQPRGQGKRSGGMVQGGMSGAPTGKRTYPDFERAGGVTPDAWKEIRLLEDEDKRVAIGALQAGRSLDEAMRLAYAAPSLTAAPTEVTPPKKEPRSVRAPAVEWPALERQQQRAVRRILAEMDAVPYTPKNFNETPKGHGGHLEVSGGAGGAPVYWDIVGGNPESGRPTFRYSRSQVAEKLRAFVEEGKRSVVSDLAVDVAERRLTGDQSLQEASLPPNAGDEPGAVIVRRQTTLSPEASAVQERAAAAVENRPEELVAAYREKFGNVVSADNAKELFEDYATKAQRTANDIAVHRPASRLSQHVFEEILHEPVPEGRDPIAVFTAGGSGAGKSTSVEVHAPILLDTAHVIQDSTMPTPANIDAARATGHEVLILLTDRQVEEAFRATLDRALEHDRPVTINTHVATHINAGEGFRALQERYADDPDVTFLVSRNSSAGGRELVPLAEWQPRRYNERDVRAQLTRILAEERTRIGEPLYQAVAGRAADATRPEIQAADQGQLRGVQSDTASGRPPENPRGTGEVVDTLDTGEAQPRLPEAGAVRDKNVKNPEFDAPFSLSAEADTTPKERVEDLFKPREMPNPGKRADTSGALVPSPASRAIALVGKEKQLRPSEIVRELSKALDQLPIKVGKFRQHALGIYKPREQTIRLKVANDLYVLAHELGHHIHDSLITSELPLGHGHAARKLPYAQELLTLGEVTSRSSYTLNQKLMEGQAEFTRYYLSDPAQAKARAPIYYAAFEQGLERHPELAGVLQRAQQQYVGHLSLDPVERGLSHIDFEGGDPHPKTDVVTRLQTAWVDDLYPLRKMVEDLAGNQPIDYVKNGYALARLARGASAKADGFLRHGVRSSDGTFVAPALEPALKPVRKQMREFAGYLTALRAVELRGRGMQTGMSLEEARAIVEKFKSPEFDKARDAVYAYQDGLLVYATAEGTMSFDQLKAMKMLNQAYVPFQRVIDDVGAAAGAGAGPGGIASKGSPVKRIKGSGRDIINPLESIVKNTHTLVAMVEQNRAMGALVDLAQKAVGGGRYLEEIPIKKVATTFNLEMLEKDIREHLADQGVDLELSSRDMFDKIVTVFTPAQFPVGEHGVVTFARNGQRRWFQVNDQALYDAISTIGPKSSDLLVNLLMKPARYLRAGATTTLGFIARNPIRDTFEAHVNSRYGFKLGYDTVRGLFEFAKKGEDYQQFVNSGAGNAAMVGMDRNRVRQELAKMGVTERHRILNTTVLNPINLLQAVSEAMEHATRLGEFKRGVEAEGRTAEGYARAGLAARDVTIDFARGGRVSKEWNRYTAFFNAAVQGTARIAEVFKADPVGATWRATTAITIPSVLLYAINRDDETYRELPEWERNTYWHIPLGHAPGHDWLRVPKPFTLGQIFANAPEAALEWFDKRDAEAVTRIVPDKTTAWKELLSIVPTALMPAIEIATNYDTFRDRAIVNPNDLNLDTALQYNRWTSALAKFVGPKIGIAPAKLDHLIYGYGGGLARGAVDAVDRGAEALDVIPRKKPAGGLGRAPLAGTFYRETPGADAQSLQAFYELRDRVEGAVGSIKRYEKAGEPEKMQQRQTQGRAELGPDANVTLDRVRVTDKALADVRDLVNQVFANRRLEPDEKKELLDRLYENMVNLARGGLGKPVLPSRFSKPPAPALLEKLTPAKPSALPPKPTAVESRPSALPPPRPSAPSATSARP